MRARHGVALAATLLWLAPLAARASAPEIETSVSETQVAKGEPIALRIRLRGAASASQPDLSPLTQAFDVLNVQRSQRTFVRNGVSDSSVDWLVELAARREGEQEIPALAVGDAATEPLRIEVSAGAASPRAGDAEPGESELGDAGANDAQSASAAPVILELHADRAQPYEHERVLLRVDLYASGDVTDGALAAPEVPGAVVEPIGKDRRIEKVIGGRSYHGIERSYTLLAEASGDIEIPPIRFEGRVRVPRPAARSQRFFGQAFFDDFFSQGAMDQDLLESFLGGGSRAVAVESEAVALHVRPRPAEAANSWWLPARDVSLSERWDPAAGPVRVGEPLTRRIELRVDGASPAQLPQLAARDVAGVKQYAEAPKASETARGTLRVDQTTLIPTQPGSVTLPAVEVAWWDTQADAARTAVLPARTLEVLPAAAGGNAPAGAGVAKAESPAAAPEASDSAAAPVPGLEASRFDGRLLAAGFAFAVGAISLLGVVIVLGRRIRGADLETRLTPRAAARALRRACRRNDPAAAESALRALGRALAPASGAWPGTRWAESLAAPELVSEIARLQGVRYLSQGEAWEGAGLWQAWRRARKPRRPARTLPALPPLYSAQESPRG